MATPNLSEVITTTLRRRTKKLADNVTDHIPLLKRLKEKENVNMVSGGRTLVRELEYAENGTFQWYDGYEALNTAASDVFTAAEFNWKQAATVIVMSGRERRMNSGDNSVINLLSSRIKNGEKTMMNNVAVGVASDGTGSGGKTIGGLQSLVADTPTSGTVGGIDRATYSFWQNQFYRGVTDGGAAVSATTIQGYMHALYLRTIRNSDRTDLIVAGTTYFKYYWDSLVAIQRITSAEDGATGFKNIAFYGPGGQADVMYDSTISATRMYFLNTDFLFFEVHEDANFVALEPRDSTNQDALARPLIFMGNLTMSNAARQGVLVA